MTARKPIVSINGQLQELPIGDSISFLKGTASVPMNLAARELEAVVTAIGVTSGMSIFLSLSPGTDADENTSQDVDLVSMSGEAGTDQITVRMTFSEMMSGPILINWSAS